MTSSLYEFFISGRKKKPFGKLSYGMLHQVMQDERLIKWLIYKIVVNNLHSSQVRLQSLNSGKTLDLNRNHLSRE